jgi:hypothetical protein
MFALLHGDPPWMKESTVIQELHITLQDLGSRILVVRLVMMVGMTRRIEAWIVDIATIITQSGILIALGTLMTWMVNRSDGKAIVSVIVTAEGLILGTTTMLTIMPKIEIQEMIDVVLHGKVALGGGCKTRWG